MRVYALGLGRKTSERILLCLIIEKQQQQIERTKIIIQRKLLACASEFLQHTQKKTRIHMREGEIIMMYIFVREIDFVY